MQILIKIGKIKAGDLFEMDGNEYVITRSGHGYPDVEFKLTGSKGTLTTTNKNLTVRLIKANH